jgi:hypothetical protein
MILAKNDANVTALADINLSDFTFKGLIRRNFCQCQFKKFTLMANDK